jgi:hypothetical protein
MPNPQPPVLLARLQSMSNQIEACQNWQSLAPYLTSALTVGSALSSNTYGSTSGKTMPSGPGYAVYTYTMDGSVHLSVAGNPVGSQAAGWFLIASGLPFAPVTNKYFQCFTDELALPGANSPGCGGCLTSTGTLNIMGVSTEAVILAFDVCLPLAW